MTKPVPELETPRLKLRGWREADFPSYAAYSADAEWQRHRGCARALPAAWEEFCASAGQWLVRGYGAWLLEEKTSGSIVGYAGFWHPADLEIPELYWGLYRAAAGQGFATEGARAALNWWQSDGPGGPVVTYTAFDNGPSQRVAERLGAQRVADAELRGEACRLYRYPELEDLRNIEKN